MTHCTTWMGAVGGRHPVGSGGSGLEGWPPRNEWHPAGPTEVHGQLEVSLAILHALQVTPETHAILSDFATLRGGSLSDSLIAQSSRCRLRGWWGSSGTLSSLLLALPLVEAAKTRTGGRWSAVELIAGTKTLDSYEHRLPARNVCVL